MNRQLLKVLLILNFCSWIALSFSMLKFGRFLPHAAESTIIVLGTLALPANLLYRVLGWLGKNKISLKPFGWFHIFILLSTLMQLIMISFFIQ